MSRVRLASIAVVSGFLLAQAGWVSAQERSFITLASTTSTENSGLYDAIFPQFSAASGIDVRVIAVGTGQALRIGRNGDADVVLVHDRASEDAFVADGFAVSRADVMYNDFIVVGPAGDPAGVGAGRDVAEAFRKIARGKALFASRGDDSGTHKAELRIWRAAGIDPLPSSGKWYRETGAGMGATLNTAVGLEAYALVDRGTWLSFRNRGGLVTLLEGDPPLHNPYGVMLVDPARHPHVKAAAGRALIEWLTSQAGQAAIAAFRVDGKQLFWPNPGRAAPVAGATPDP